ncbi:MAG: ISKra4 family transposase [Waddliaceae bacterium]
MEQHITQAKKQFNDILSYVQGQAQGQQLNEVEKGIFYSLLKLGMTLLLVFFQQKGVGHKGKVHIDKESIRRPYHSIKHREYLSIFGRISIPRACYWAKGRHEIYPLDAELNLPGVEYSYVLQEWSAALGSEEPYEKAARFLESVLKMPLWGTAVETVMHKSSVDVPKFYEKRQGPDAETEKGIIVATADGKGVVMRKDQIEKKVTGKRLRKMRKTGERVKKKVDKKNEKPGKKKMSTVIGVYTIDSHERTVEDFLTRGKDGKKRPHPCNKVVQATLEGKECAFQRLKEEVAKRDPQKKKQAVAIVDGEHKLRQLMKKYLPWFLIIIDIYHVMEYLWKGAHVFYREGSPEAASWITDKLNKLLLGKVKEVIAEFKELLETVSGERKERLRKVITYLENGKNYMRYDIYLKRGYPIGSGVVEGACKNLVKDRMEQCGMRWTIAGAEAVLAMRSIQINGMTGDYWQYHIAQEKQRLYGNFMENETMETMELAA